MSKAHLLWIPLALAACGGLADLGGRAVPDPGQHVDAGVDGASSSDAGRPPRGADAGRDAAPGTSRGDGGDASIAHDARVADPRDAVSDRGDTGAPVTRDAAADSATATDARSFDAAPVPRDAAPVPRDAASACDDNLQNGDETDVDCGGSCPPCSRAQRCVTDADCGSGPGCDAEHGGCTCDSVTSTCVYNHCLDYRMDYSETAIDCGGGDCPGCGPGKGCLEDTDCSATLPGCQTCTCDALTSTCVFDHCWDNKLNWSEIEVDCGGGHCKGCALGQKCVLDGDCASNACDAVSRVCVQEQCSDHHADGDETDADCGGSTCGQCGLYEKCRTNSDCLSGTCQPGNPHICI